MTKEWQKRNKEKQREYMKASRIKHIEERQQYDLDRYAANRERWKQYYLEHREERLAKCKEYKKTDVCKEAARKYMAKRLQDPQIRLIHNLRGRLKQAMKRINRVKEQTTKMLLGCTPQELKIHIESKFSAGMTWDNYGQWHIDHIVPVASFDLSDPEQQRKCFHYTNLQPLWALENFVKSDKTKTEISQECGKSPL